MAAQSSISVTYRRRDNVTRINIVSVWVNHRDYDVTYIVSYIANNIWHRKQWQKRKAA